MENYENIMTLMEFGYGFQKLVNMGQVELFRNLKMTFSWGCPLRFYIFYNIIMDIYQISLFGLSNLPYNLCFVIHLAGKQTELARQYNQGGFIYDTTLPSGKQQIQKFTFNLMLKPHSRIKQKMQTA